MSDEDPNYLTPEEREVCNLLVNAAIFNRPLQLTSAQTRVLIRLLADHFSRELELLH